MKFLIVVNDAFSLHQFRKGLIMRLIALGHTVHVAVPESSYCTHIAALGAQVTCMDIPRFMDPAGDVAFMLNVWRLCRREKFDIVHCTTTKPNIYAAIGARLAGIKRIYGLVSGAGFAFMEEAGLTQRVFQKIVRMLFRIGFSCMQRVWFQNADDAREFVERRLIAEKKVLVIRGSGVDPDYFTRTPDVVEKSAAIRRQYAIPDKKCVLMVTARRIWSKGIREFFDAARMLQERFPDWIFVLVAPHDHGSPDLVPQSYFDEYRPANLWLIEDFQADIRPFYAFADIVALLSYYREGVPRSLLEGMSFGCPIVTTDSIGCREAVMDGENGNLVRVRDSADFSAKLAHIMQNPLLAQTMGQASRRLAQTVFSEEHVVDQVITRLYGFEQADIARHNKAPEMNARTQICRAAG